MRKKQFRAESKRLMDLMINSIYTNKEIFLRELISNASDAIDKLYYTGLTGRAAGLSRDSFAITITRTPDGRMLTISDNGIGMSKEDLEENLGTICKSGSLQFKQEMQEQEEIDIIGQFGVGFYSAFMVAERITVVSRKYGQDTAWQWTSVGGDGYTVTETQREQCGTDVILTLKADTEEEEYGQYLQEHRIRGLVRRYSDYIRYPIRMEVTKSRRTADSTDDNPQFESYTEVETLNTMVPIWQRSKQEVTAEEYETFYREKFFDYTKPCRTIHMSAEGTVSFKALLYIPGRAPMDFYSKDFKRGLQLYSSGVLIMENCEQLLPEHFRFVRGIVDTQDISLNISREMLQHSRQLAVIARNIEKKIKSELLAMLESEREAYEAFYAVFGRQLKYGCVADYGAHMDATKDLLLFASRATGKQIALKEYVAAMPQAQEKIYFAPGENKDLLQNLPQVRALQSKGYDVLLFTDEVDEFIPQTMTAYADKPFCNVTTEELDLQTEEEKQALAAKAEEMKGILTFVKDTLGDSVVQVRLSGDLGAAPVCLTPDSGMSFEMEKYMKRVDPDFAFSSGRILELNPDHEAVKAVVAAVTSDPLLAADYVRLLHAQALLMAQLPLEDPLAYTELVCKLIR